MAQMAAVHSDYDGAWKEALELYLAEAIAFFFPQIYDEIDWSQGYEFLDKELQQVTPEADVGRRRADKLVKVWRKNGEETWVLIHIEVQSQKVSNFAERMYIYNYRIFDHYHRTVVSLAVLGDEQTRWNPERFERGLWGCEVTFKFPTVKLLDYKERWSELEESDNLFAVVVMAHLRAQETRSDQESRKKWKLYLIRQLYERGCSREDVLNLFRFIDWTMSLPKEVEDEIWQEVQEYEEEKQMKRLTSLERIGMEKGFQKGMRKGIQEGMQQGMQQGIQEGMQQGIQEGMQQGIREGLLAGIELGLELKFGSAGLRLLPEIYKIEDVDVLRAIHEGLKTVTELGELQAIYHPNVAEKSGSTNE